MTELKPMSQDDQKKVVESNSKKWENVQIAGKFTIRAARKITVKTITNVAGNLDTGADLSAATLFYLAGHYSAINSNLSLVFAGCGVIAVVFRLRLPQGKLYEWLKLSPEEMNKSVLTRQYK